MKRTINRPTGYTFTKMYVNFTTQVRTLKSLLDMYIVNSLLVFQILIQFGWNPTGKWLKTWTAKSILTPAVVAVLPLKDSSLQHLSGWVAIYFTRDVKIFKCELFFCGNYTRLIIPVLEKYKKLSGDDRTPFNLGYHSFVKNDQEG